MKRKILKILSSCFGLFALCGLSLFSLLHNKKETQSVSALSGDVILEQSTFNGTLSWNASNDNYTGISSVNYIGSYTYFVRGTGVVDVVYLKFFITFGFNFYDNDTQETVVLTPNVSSFTSDEVQVNTSNEAGVYKCYMSLTSFAVYTAPYLQFYSQYNDEQGVFIGNTQNLSFTPSGYPVKQGQRTAQSIIFGFSYTGDVPSYDTAYQEGYQIGYQNGYSIGSVDGASAGYDSGFVDGVASQVPVINNAYADGYNTGYNEAYTADSTVSTIFSNILLVGMLPVDIFLRMLNWEFLGINIAGFVSALVSVAATVIVIRLVTGKKNG